MSEKVKKILFIISIILIIFIAIILIYIKRNEDNDVNVTPDGNNKVITNTNKDVISDKVISNLIFTDIKYTYDFKETKVFMNIINNNTESVKISRFIIKIYNEKNELVETLNPVYNNIIKPNSDINNFMVTIEKDLSNAYKIEIELPELEFIKEVKE